MWLDVSTEDADPQYLEYPGPQMVGVPEGFLMHSHDPGPAHLYVPGEDRWYELRDKCEGETLYGLLLGTDLGPVIYAGRSGENRPAAWLYEGELP